MYITNHDDSENWIDGDNFTIKEFDDELKKRNAAAKRSGDMEPTYHEATLHLSEDKAQQIYIECGPDAGDLVQQMKRLASLEDRKWEIQNTLNMENGSIYPEPLYDPAHIPKDRPYVTVKNDDGLGTQDKTLYEYERDCHIFPPKDGTLNIPGEPPITFTSSNFGRNHAHDLNGYLQAVNPVLAQRMALETNESKLRYLQSSRVPPTKVRENAENTVHIKDSKADCILSGDDFYDMDFQDYVKTVDERYRLKGRTVPVTFQYQGKMYTQEMGSGKAGLEYLNSQNPDMKTLRQLDERRYARANNRYSPSIVIEYTENENGRFEKGETLQPLAFVELADQIQDGSDVEISCRMPDEPPDQHKTVTIHLDGSGTHRQLKQYADIRPTMYGLRSAVSSLQNDREYVDSEHKRNSRDNSQTKNEVVKDRPHFIRYFGPDQGEDLTFAELDNEKHERDNTLFGVVAFPDGCRYPIAPNGESLKDDKYQGNNLMEMIDRSTISKEVADQIEISRNNPGFWMEQDCNILAENFGSKTLTTATHPNFYTSYDLKTRSPQTATTSKVLPNLEPNGQDQACLSVENGKIKDVASGKDPLNDLKDKQQRAKYAKKKPQKTQPTEDESRDIGLPRRGR